MVAIEYTAGNDISRYSYYRKENEILLLPARQFQVVAAFKPSTDLHIIQMKEIRSLVNPPPSGKISDNQWHNWSCVRLTGCLTAVDRRFLCLIYPISMEKTAVNRFSNKTNRGYLTVSDRFVSHGMVWTVSKHTFLR